MTAQRMVFVAAAGIVVALGVIAALQNGPNDMHSTPATSTEPKRPSRALAPALSLPNEEASPSAAREEVPDPELPLASVGAESLLPRANSIVARSLVDGVGANPGEVAALIEEILSVSSIKQVQTVDGREHLTLDAGREDMSITLIRDQPGADSEVNAQVRIDYKAERDIRPFLGADFASIEMSVDTKDGIPSRATTLVHSLPNYDDLQASQYFVNTIQAGTAFTLSPEVSRTLLLGVTSYPDKSDWKQEWNDAPSTYSFEPSHYSGVASLMNSVGRSN